MSAIYPLLFTNCLFMSKIQSRTATYMYLIDTAGDWNMKSPDHSSLVRKKVDGTDIIPGVGDLGGSALPTSSNGVLPCMRYSSGARRYSVSLGET